MGRMERQKAKLDLEEDGKTDDARNSSYSLVVLSSSDDDEEANEDLSLKIVEKALLTRAAKLVAEDTIPDGTQGYNGGGGSSGVVALSSSSALEEEVFEVPSGSDGTVGSVNVHLGKRKVVKRERRKKIKKTATADKTVSTLHLWLCSFSANIASMKSFTSAFFFLASLRHRLFCSENYEGLFFYRIKISMLIPRQKVAILCSYDQEI